MATSLIIIIRMELNVMGEGVARSKHNALLVLYQAVLYVLYGVDACNYEPVECWWTWQQLCK